MASSYSLVPDVPGPQPPSNTVTGAVRHERGLPPATGKVLPIPSPPRHQTVTRVHPSLDSDVNSKGTLVRMPGITLDRRLKCIADDERPHRLSMRPTTVEVI
jgi:hypothetical protein